MMKERFDIFLILNLFVHKQQYLFVLLHHICMDWFELDKLFVDDFQYETCQPERSFFPM